MYISQIELKGFRNFKNAKIEIAKKSLIIGSNDIGKSNLLHSLRILLDRTLSEADIEPQDSDFYAFEETNELEILIAFKEVNEDCILAKMKEYVSDDAELLLCYRAKRDSVTRKTNYFLFAGKDKDSLTKIESRYYLRVLNVKFIGSRRNLFDYIRRERKNLIQDAKLNRSDEEMQNDSTLLENIETSLSNVNDHVRNLSYVNKATGVVNNELDNLSVKNIGQEVIFDTGASDPSAFVENLQLASRVQGKTIAIGGDGRKNQIHLALWWARNSNIIEENPLEVSIYCIEEPEAHLHPHQQRKLAEYLSCILKDQVIITTHSPQITSEFSPSSIIRLFNHIPDTQAAGNGINPFAEDAFIKFGHRMNIIPAETFFSDVVLLVEGTSEELFYKALSTQIGIDLDRLNISILKVDGIGFKTYISLLNTLNIDWVIRTDNDIFKIPKKEEYYFAGVKRGISYYREYFDEDKQFEELLDVGEEKLSGFSSLTPTKDCVEASQKIIKALQKFNIFLAIKDLEKDLSEVLIAELENFLQKYEKDIIDEMKKQKATFMFNFLRENISSLSSLGENELAEPLKRCREIVEKKYGNSTNL